MLNLILDMVRHFQKIRGNNSTDAHSTYVQNEKHHPSGMGEDPQKVQIALQVLSKSKTMLKEGLANKIIFMSVLSLFTFFLFLKCRFCLTVHK